MDKAKMKSIHFEIPKELHTYLKLLAVRNGMTLKELFLQSIEIAKHYSNKRN